MQAASISKDDDSDDDRAGPPEEGSALMCVLPDAADSAADSAADGAADGVAAADDDDPYGLLGGLRISAGAFAQMQEWIGYANGEAPRAAAGDDSPFDRGGGPPAAPAAAPFSDECACGGRLRRSTSGLEYICDGCGLIVEGDSTVESEDDVAARAAPTMSRLTIVGPGSSQLQPDLYRSGSGCSADQQKKQIFEEYKMYRARYIEEGGRAFPLDACARAAANYNLVQQVYVKRSQNKKAIMAYFFYHACLELDFAPEKPEVMRFMQLQNRGIARGANFVRKFAADGKMDGVNVNIDPCRPEITTLFASLGLSDPKYRPLSDAVYAIVQTAIREHIASSSILRSKVAGAAYTVLRRCEDRSLIKVPPTLTNFCKSYRIRKNTIGNMIAELEGHHSYFQRIYEQAGLNARPPSPKA